MVFSPSPSMTARGRSTGTPQPENAAWSSQRKVGGKIAMSIHGVNTGLPGFPGGRNTSAESSGKIGDLRGEEKI
jgi:hypothetical protein